MNSNSINSLPHEPRKPVEIERLPGDVLYIEGVKYAGDFFRTMGYPNAKYLYAIQRNGDQVILTTIHDVEEAKKFFEEGGIISLTPNPSPAGRGERDDGGV